MGYFDLSSAQKMLLFSEINNPNNDSFYLKFRKDYDLDDFEYVKSAIEEIIRNYLTLEIKQGEDGDFKQYFASIDDVNVETFEVLKDDLDKFIKDYLDNPFEDVFESPLYKWAVIKTESSTVLIGVVQHILLDGSSLFSIVPKEIERYIDCKKNNEEFVPIDYSYETYVNAELDYLKSDVSEIRAMGGGALMILNLAIMKFSLIMFLNLIILHLSQHWLSISYTWQSPNVTMSHLRIWY